MMRILCPRSQSLHPETPLLPPSLLARSKPILASCQLSGGCLETRSPVLQPRSRHRKCARPLAICTCMLINHAVVITVHFSDLGGKAWYQGDLDLAACGPGSGPRLLTAPGSQKQAVRHLRLLRWMGVGLRDSQFRGSVPAGLTCFLPCLSKSRLFLPPCLCYPGAITPCPSPIALLFSHALPLPRCSSHLH